MAEPQQYASSYPSATVIEVAPNRPPQYHYTYQQGPMLPARDPRYPAMIADPAHGGASNQNSHNEARIALTMEYAGQVPGPVRRDSTGGADFVDGRGRRYDIKTPMSEQNMPPRRQRSTRRPLPPGPRPGAFNVDNTIATIRREAARGERVTIDVSNLTFADRYDLLETIVAENLTEWVRVVGVPGSHSRWP
jgi:hypothetical protein